MSQLNYPDQFQLGQTTEFPQIPINPLDRENDIRNSSRTILDEMVARGLMDPEDTMIRPGPNTQEFRPGRVGEDPAFDGYSDPDTYRSDAAQEPPRFSRRSVLALGAVAFAPVIVAAGITANMLHIGSHTERSVSHPSDSGGNTIVHSEQPSSSPIVELPSSTSIHKIKPSPVTHTAAPKHKAPPTQEVHQPPLQEDQEPPTTTSNPPNPIELPTPPDTTRNHPIDPEKPVQPVTTTVTPSPEVSNPTATSPQPTSLAPLT